MWEEQTLPQQDPKNGREGPEPALGGVACSVRAFSWFGPPSAPHYVPCFVDQGYMVTAKGVANLYHTHAYSYVQLCIGYWYFLGLCVWWFWVVVFEVGSGKVPQ